MTGILILNLALAATVLVAIVGGLAWTVASDADAPRRNLDADRTGPRRDGLARASRRHGAQQAPANHRAVTEHH